jgi:asparagine synthase (glutamine-hydrolysing)
MVLDHLYPIRIYISFVHVQVSDSMMMNASFVYPDNTPTTKEAYYYRTVFEKFYPKNAARLTVPGGPSVACNTAKAVEWDAAWSKLLDPSGRAALGVHDAAYEDTPEKAPVSSVDPVTENVFRRPAHGESLVPAAAV